MASTIWLTDRSRYETGLGRCLRERYLEYHFGPSGYGIRRVAESIPLARGIYIHEGAAILFAHLQAEDTLPPDELVRMAATAASTKYLAVIEAKGLRNLDAGDTVDRIAKEQAALITGSVWTLHLELLPWFHANYRVVSVEQEEVAVLGCTCGLGDLVGDVATHEARDCQGIGWMSRADVIGEHRATGRLAYFEIKTGGYPSRAEDWETKIQFSAAVLGVEARLERPIDETWVLNLIVGKREGSYNYETKKKDGPVMQQSVLCYGYRKLPTVPGMVEEWAAEYSYQDEHGKNRKLTRDFQKAGVWEIDPRLTGGVDPAEYWVRWLPAGVRAQQVALVGPMQRQPVLLAGFTQELVAHEQEWQRKLWELYDLQQDLSFDSRVGEDRSWAHAEYQAALNRLIPRSWACNRYGQRYGCAFKPLCFRHEGWEDPLGSGHYQLRRPHHTPEVSQAEARGIELPAAEGEEEEG